MNFNKIKKVVFCLIVLFTIYKTINYFEWIKNKKKIEEIIKQNEEYIKNINNLVTKFKNRLLELEKDSEKTLQEIAEVKEDNLKTHEELAKVRSDLKKSKEDNSKTNQEIAEVKAGNSKTHQELAEIKEAMKSMMSLMKQGLT